MTSDGPGPGRRRALLVSHALMAALIALAAAALMVEALGAPADGVTLAPLVVAELILLGIAASIVLLFERYGPLLLVDVLVAAPLAAILFGSAGDGPGVLVSVGLVAVAVVAAVLAALEVRRRQVERIGIAVALIALAVALAGAPAVAAVPVLVLVVLAAPPPPASWRLASPRPGRALANRRATGARASGRGGGAPDAAAILATRPVGAEPGRTAVLHSAPHGEDREE